MFGSKQSFLGLFELQFKMNDKKGKERKKRKWKSTQAYYKNKEEMKFHEQITYRRSLKNSICLL